MWNKPCYEFEASSLFIQLEENVQVLLQRVEPKAGPVPVQAPVSPPTSASAPDPATAPLPAPDIPAPLPTPLEGDDGLPQPPPPADEEEQQQQQSGQLQLQEQQQEQSDAAEKLPEEPVVDGIAGKHKFFYFLNFNKVFTENAMKSVFCFAINCNPLYLFAVCSSCSSSPVERKCKGFPLHFG